MGRNSGGVRGTRPGTSDYMARMSEVEKMRLSGLYSSVEFIEKNGGYLAFEKSNRLHKPEEIEAARYMANSGYKVILKSEDGSVTTPDGYVFSMTYEQKTPKREANTPGDNSVRRAMMHARKKNAEVVVIYDKYESYHREDIENGIRLFENGDGGKLKASAYRFKIIIVVDNAGRVYEHNHNDI